MHYIIVTVFISDRASHFDSSATYQSCSHSLGSVLELMRCFLIQQAAELSLDFPSIFYLIPVEKLLRLHVTYVNKII